MWRQKVLPSRLEATRQEQILSWGSLYRVDLACFDFTQSTHNLYHIYNMCECEWIASPARQSQDCVFSVPFGWCAIRSVCEFGINSRNGYYCSRGSINMMSILLVPCRSGVYWIPRYPFGGRPSSSSTWETPIYRVINHNNTTFNTARNREDKQENS